MGGTEGRNAPYPTLLKVYSEAELQREFSFSDDELK